jgi:hypothetical protein
MAGVSFKMNFKNFGPSGLQKPNIQYNNLANIPSNVRVAPPRNQSLNSPMVGRIYAAKPGCSSCGKKVA